MTELRRVSGPPSWIDRHLGRIIAVVVVGVLLAVLKPWGDGTPAPLGALATATPIPSATPVPTPSEEAAATYDFGQFGVFEPPPHWEVWAAGTLASFGFAMRVDMAPQGSYLPIESGAPTPSPDLSAASAAVPDDWPPVLLPPGGHLELIAINHPLDRTITLTRLVRIDTDGLETPMHALLATSPWPSHVLVIGLGMDDGSAGMRPWPPATYRLDVAIGPDGENRSLVVKVDTLQIHFTTPASDAPSTSAGPSASDAPSASVAAPPSVP